MSNGRDGRDGRDCCEKKCYDEVLCFYIGNNENIGSYYQYVKDDLKIDAYGYSRSVPDNLPTDMFSKGNLPNETGVGIESDQDHEINKQSFIQLDLCHLFHYVKECSIPEITIGSIQQNEGFSIYGSNVLSVNSST